MAARETMNFHRKKFHYSLLTLPFYIYLPTISLHTHTEIDVMAEYFFIYYITDDIDIITGSRCCLSFCWRLYKTLLASLA